MKLDKAIFNAALHGQKDESSDTLQVAMNRLNVAIGNLAQAAQNELPLKEYSRIIETEVYEALNVYGSIAAGKVMREYMLSKDYGQELLAKHEEKADEQTKTLNWKMVAGFLLWAALLANPDRFLFEAPKPKPAKTDYQRF